MIHEKRHTCYNCKFWKYNDDTEMKYGMGVGICRADNSEQFCEHPACIAYKTIDDDDIEM